MAVRKVCGYFDIRVWQWPTSASLACPGCQLISHGQTVLPSWGQGPGCQADWWHQSPTHDHHTHTCSILKVGYTCTSIKILTKFAPLAIDNYPLTGTCTYLHVCIWEFIEGWVETNCKTDSYPLIYYHGNNRECHWTVVGGCGLASMVRDTWVVGAVVAWLQ